MTKIKIACVGDSLTAGYNVKENARWSNLLSNELNVEIVNHGISGDTTAGMLARFNEVDIIHKPTHVIIMGGTNDLFFNLHENQIVSNIHAMTRHSKHNEIIPIIGIPTPFYSSGNNSDESIFINTFDFEKRLYSYQQKLREFATDDNQNIIDFTKNLKSEYFLNDGLHPNEEGHICMMETAKQFLIKIL